jgi:hypothetical protein
MAKVILTFLLFISLGFSIITYQYPGIGLESSVGQKCYISISQIVNIVKRKLNISNLTAITIYECQNLIEFSKISGEPYSTGGIYKDGFIIIQPFKILKKKKLLKKILTHEILHYFIEQKYSPPVWLEEGYIEYVLNDIPEELEGYHKIYLEKFLKKVTDEKKNIAILFNNYKR